MVKRSAWTWRITFEPTTTLTATVKPPFADSKSRWPMNVPGTRPDPGRFAFWIETDTWEGAVPLERDAFSQLPPSAVVLVRVQDRVPEPPLRISSVCAGGALPAVFSEKLIWPGKSLKCGVTGSTTVRVTGTVT